MGLIKKIDVPKYFAALRASRLAAQTVAAGSVSHPDATGVAEIPPLGASANVSDLIADFSLDISSLGVSPAPAK